MIIWRAHSKAGLTDVVVLSARSELKAQGERSEELELLRELERSVGGVRPVALPALEALGGVVARAVAIVVDHVEDVALCPLLRHCVFVVRTVDIQVVVYAHVDVVVPTMEPERREDGERLTFCFFRSSRRTDHLFWLINKHFKTCFSAVLINLRVDESTSLLLSWMNVCLKSIPCINAVLISL